MDNHNHNWYSLVFYKYFQYNFLSIMGRGMVNWIDIKPLVNDKCPGFFSDFAGKSIAQKPNKSQTKREKITGVKYFRRI